MTKSRLSIGAWLDKVFGKTHKDLSETLSAEQYNEFVKGATSIRGAVDTEEGDADPADAGDETATASADAETPTQALATDQQAKILSLTNQLTEAQSALTTEKDAHAATTGLLTAAQNDLNATAEKLTASELQKQKLRDAVNPLGDEDLNNADPGANQGLTKSDIEARENYKKNRSEATAKK